MRLASIRGVRAAAAAVAILIALGAPAGAQTAYFLEPSTFTSRVGEEVRFGLVAGGPAPDAIAVPTRWPAAIKWLFIRSGGAQDNRYEITPVGDGAESRVALTMPAAGCAMIGVDFQPEVVVLTGEQFAGVLAARTGVTPDEALPSRAQVRVRHVRSAKALVRVAHVGDAPEAFVDAATAVSKSGQAVEIRPFNDPTRIAPGGDLPMRMYIGGDAFGKPRVRGTHAASGASSEPVPASTPSLPVTAAGPWRVEFHHAAPLTNDPDADWAFYTSTLIFSAPEKAPEPPANEGDAR